MKIVQTFWSGTGASMNNAAGWLSAEYHWMSWALSCLQAKKFFGRVELVTDEVGKEILIDRLKLPYDHVSTSLQLNYPSELWSLAKIFSYGSQQEPFIHIDGDVYIWQPFSAEFPLMAQNVEVNIPYYANVLSAISNRFVGMPAHEGNIYASNTGIFGGHDLDFIKEYCRQAFDFVDKNMADIIKMRPDKRPLLNFIFEQYLLFYLAREHKKHITYFWKEEVTDPLYGEFARFTDIPDTPLIHPVGAFKSRLFTCMHVGNRLRKDYPEFYYRIINECSKEFELVNKYHQTENKNIVAFNNMVQQFERTANLFANKDQIRTGKICFNNEVTLQENLASWLEPELLQVQEVSLDQLEMIILSLSHQPIAINDVLAGARDYFDEAEISQNPQAYEQLIIDNIKHLLYLRVLQLCAT